MKRHFLFAAGGPNDNSGGGVPAGTPVTNQLIGQVTDAQIAEWKIKYPLGIYGIKVGGHIAYFRNPSFDDLNYGYSKSDQNAIMDIWVAFAEVTMLGGSKEVLSNATLFSGAMRELQKKVGGAKAEVSDL